jgi:hypothetical protein
MTAVVRIVLKPFLAIHSRAVKSVAAMSPSPLKRQIEMHEASGEDLCSKASKEYLSWQSQLFQYRKERLQQEFAYVKGGGISLATATGKDYILLLRFLTKLLFVVILGTIVGRGAVFPLLPPNSALLEANEENIQHPNLRRWIGLQN